MVKADAVPLTRSPAEISALTSLRSLPELLLYSRHPQSAKPSDRGRNAVATSSVAALRSLCSTHGRRSSITDATAQAELGSLERWLALADISAKLNDDVLNLEREIQTHERKRNALAAERDDGSSATRLPPAEACELGPKLQCLQEVLGTARFRAYCRDLFVLVGNLRLRLELYGVRMRDFERQLSRERSVSVEKLLCLLNESDAADVQPIEHADYALLLQHCSDPGHPEAVIVTEDLTALLRSLPLERATLVRYVFEQLADTRRGEGYRPPPDHTKVHHIQAAIKLQRSHCSTEEVRAAEAWLEVVGSDAITLQDLIEFHLSVSDANATEDAEFVRFVQRMWGFDPLAVKDADRGEAIQQLLENYTARCHLAELAARKRELLAKIPGAQARIRSASVLLESELQHLRVLQAPAGFSRWLQCDESINHRLGAALVLLRELTLSGQVLPSIPDFVGSLKELQVLDLRDNRIVTISSMLGTLQTLRRLDLSDNLLRDASFAQADEVWSQLEVLTDLRLGGNKLTSLPSALVTIPSLTTLDLSRNSLRTIRGEVVQHWKGRSRLVTLDLHANSLTTLPEDIHVLFGTLRRLILHQNHLVSLPSRITELIRLEELSLSQNQLAGESLASYPLPEGLSAISLAHNQLRVAPCLVVVHTEGKGPPPNRNSSVTTIDLRGNRLRSAVDWSPLVLASCQSLHLQNNGLRELPDGFFRALPALRVCELQCNQLRTLPVGITECTQLRILDVHDNCLQKLPKELVQLTSLEVLNAAENDLTEIPIEWHAFETQSDGARVLHSLLLRRNPLHNKVLKTIVDGSTDGAPSTTKAHLTASTDDPACEGVIKKLLDCLRDASTVQRGADAGRVRVRKAWVDSDEEEDSKPKWRGVARDVNRYLEQRLRAMQRPHQAASLVVDAKSFERMIRTLPFTSSKPELTHLVRRFRVQHEDEELRGESTKQVDGLAFLQAIERFGRWRSISMPSKRQMSSVAKPTIDSAGPIVQYLAVLHRRTQEEKQERRGRQSQKDHNPQPKTKPPSHVTLRSKQKERAKETPRTQDARTTKRKTQPSTNQDPPPFNTSCKTRADVIADRQRQRIQVLEQQLVDQKLLLLAHQKPATSDKNDPAIAPADLQLVSEEDLGSRGTSGDGDSSERFVIVSVKCLHLPGADEVGGHHAVAKAPARVELRLRSDDSVLHLKQQLETRTGVPVDHQIVITNSASRGVPAIRLRNGAELREYSEHVGGVSKWSLALLIGQSLPLLRGDSATGG
ncbi:hypothetical protein PR003_g301 [Phytophthora rubi]|uniref:Ubiquitin-like domain-containing protein n=1 Tax=Phytophthora rubi TaxID=129364 RepID=A0A6A3P0D8_9STRA|nr:hypothetical protein PR002_g1249 [Phytophthora rubi]KAE9052619.1 hypothetical protein PR001_g336 [Phytophthora rubi]KAE9360262.1 hypothetical protein PR003_g301 [Phytophthora rubi]